MDLNLTNNVALIGVVSSSLVQVKKDVRGYFFKLAVVREFSRPKDVQHITCFMPESELGGKLSSRTFLLGKKLRIDGRLVGNNNKHFVYVESARIACEKENFRNIVEFEGFVNEYPKTNNTHGKWYAMAEVCNFTNCDDDSNEVKVKAFKPMFENLKHVKPAEKLYINGQIGSTDVPGITENEIRIWASRIKR